MQKIKATKFDFYVTNLQKDSLQDIGNAIIDYYKSDKNSIIKLAVIRAESQQIFGYFELQKRFHTSCINPELSNGTKIYIKQSKLDIDSIIKGVKSEDLFLYNQQSSEFEQLLKLQTEKEIMKYLMENQPQNLLNKGVRLIKNVQEIQNVLLDDEQENSDFQYKYPSHLIPQEDDQSEFNNLKTVLYRWYQHEVEPLNNVENKYVRRKGRGKALFLYSPGRGKGKTSFAKSLVGAINSQGDLDENDQKKIIHIKGTFTPEDFKNIKQAKILILDDVNIPQRQNIQMWKALVSSEKAAIRDAFINILYPGGRPVVICSNDIEFYELMFKHPYFEEDVDIVDLGDQFTLIDPLVQRQVQLKRTRNTYQSLYGIIRLEDRSKIASKKIKNNGLAKMETTLSKKIDKNRYLNYYSDTDYDNEFDDEFDE